MGDGDFQTIFENKSKWYLKINILYVLKVWNADVIRIPDKSENLDAQLQPIFMHEFTVQCVIVLARYVVL